MNPPVSTPSGTLSGPTAVRVHPEFRYNRPVRWTGFGGPGSSPSDIGESRRHRGSSLTIWHDGPDPFEDPVLAHVGRADAEDEVAADRLEPGSNVSGEGVAPWQTSELSSRSSAEGTLSDRCDDSGAVALFGHPAFD
jgi:hypothetical protein